MKRLIFVTAGIVLFAAIFAWFSLHRPYRQENADPRQRLAPNFKLPDFDGRPHRLEEFSGNLLIVHFWATWCPPCVKEIPNLLEFAKSLGNRKIKILTVSLDPKVEDAEKLLPKAALEGISHLVSVIDTSQSVSDAFGSYQFPESYLISPDGRIIFKWVGAENWTSKEMKEFLDKAEVLTAVPPGLRVQ